MLVDTDILIDVLRGVPDAISHLQNLERSVVVAISAVTMMELLVGCRDKNEQHAIERFVQRFRVVKLTEPISDRAVGLLQRYRLSHGLLIADALIAATALVLDEPLATKNQRDYRFIAGLHLPPYP